MKKAFFSGSSHADIAKRPFGLSTRRSSLAPCTGSAQNIRPSLQVTASNDASANSSAVRSIGRCSMLSTPAERAMRIAAASITGRCVDRNDSCRSGCTRSASASDGNPVPQAASRMTCLGAAPLASQNQRVIGCEHDCVPVVPLLPAAALNRFARHSAGTSAARRERASIFFRLRSRASRVPSGVQVQSARMMTRDARRSEHVRTNIDDLDDECCRRACCCARPQRAER